MDEKLQMAISLFREVIVDSRLSPELPISRFLIYVERRSEPHVMPAMEYLVQVYDSVTAKRLQEYNLRELLDWVNKQ